MGWGFLNFCTGARTFTFSPVLAVYAGYSMMQEHVDPGPALDPYVQDAMDEIEYVTGAIDTQWGAQRAKDVTLRLLPSIS